MPLGTRSRVHHAGWIVAAAVPLLVAAPRVSRSQTDRVPQPNAWMKHHFEDVVDLHDAVVRGDLRSARTLAKQIAVEPDPPRVTDAGRARLGRIRAMASDVAAASSIETAAEATAGIVATCGDCHEAVGVRMPPPPEPPASDLGGVVGHMLTHRKGLESLLAGLVIPSTSEWNTGARQLQGAALPLHDLPRDPKLTSQVAAADKQVHALATEALAATTLDARVAVYSKLLTTCASCHSLHPSVWGPTR